VLGNWFRFSQYIDSYSLFLSTDSSFKNSVGHQPDVDDLDLLLESAKPKEHEITGASVDGQSAASIFTAKKIRTNIPIEKKESTDPPAVGSRSANDAIAEAAKQALVKEISNHLDQPLAGSTTATNPSQTEQLANFKNSSAAENLDIQPSAEPSIGLRKERRKRKRRKRRGDTRIHSTEGECLTYWML